MEGARHRNVCGPSVASHSCVSGTIMNNKHLVESFWLSPPCLLPPCLLPLCLLPPCLLPPCLLPPCLLPPCLLPIASLPLCLFASLPCCLVFLSTRVRRNESREKYKSRDQKKYKTFCFSDETKIKIPLKKKFQEDFFIGDLVTAYCKRSILNC